NHTPSPIQLLDFIIFIFLGGISKIMQLIPESKLTFNDILSDPRCLEPMKPGDCRNYVVKWYYDKNGNSCGQFWYGGCSGTNNRFETEKESCLSVTHDFIYKSPIGHPQ
uniref:BPTI/Kunitz inhibitor domain-containing protein n=1 Tax=Otus sunia TaxID=257818 RepID=A0A8C8BCE2_9STRI